MSQQVIHNRIAGFLERSRVDRNDVLATIDARTKRPYTTLGDVCAGHLRLVHFAGQLGYAPKPQESVCEELVKEHAKSHEARG